MAYERVLMFESRLPMATFLIALLLETAGCRSHKPVRPVIAPATEQVVSHWDAPFQPSLPLSHDVEEQRAQAVIEQSRFELNSRKPFQEVVIPFQLRYGRPYVQANWAGRRIDCLVDTGSYSIFWPQWLQLDTQQIHVPTVSVGPEGPVLAGEMVVSPRIQIGDLMLVNTLTEAVGIPRPLLPTGPDMTLREGLTCPIIGMDVFRPSVLTIDYQHQTLIVRNRDYDVTRLPRRPQTILAPYEMDGRQRVIFSGTLSGHPARFMLDTGTARTLVSTAFARKNLGYVPPGISGSSLKTSASSATPVWKVTGSLFGKSIGTAYVYVVERTGEADVMLSGLFFRHYRITIDPYRKMLLLEKNAK
jgi:predicted aspartyl protease